MTKPASKKPGQSGKAELSELKTQLAQLTEALQRERADATNIRRRHDNELNNLRTAVKANLVRELLPVIDNLERALKHVPKDLVDNPYIKGIEAVVKQFDQILKSLNVERIKTVGEVFDPRYHEAVSLEEGSGTKEVVSEELQAGYTVNGEVIRHAIVKVTMQ